MTHLLVHIHQDITGDKTKLRTQQYMQLNIGAKEIQQLKAAYYERLPTSMQSVAIH